MSDSWDVFLLDRVFVTLLFMGFKYIQLSSGIHLLDPILAVLNEQLSVLDGESNNPLSLAHLDLPLVNWLLLFTCCCLDKTVASSSATSTKESTLKAAARDQRWDFLQGEQTGNIQPTESRTF